MLTRPTGSGPLPFEYLRDLFYVLLSCPGIRFKSYADLPFNFDRRPSTQDDLTALYREEAAQYRRDTTADGKVDVLLLHDCDSGPAETEYLCQYEAALKIRSTTSLFANVLDRHGNVVPYEIDYARLSKLQQDGICFSYHCNAGELCDYRDERIAERCNSDVEALTAKCLDIRFFSPHGGRPSEDGRNNNSYFYPPLFDKNLVWTHNRFAPHGRRYSDGSLVPRLLSGAPATDLRSYLMETVDRAQRVFILLHPQYYFGSQPTETVLRSENAPEWYREYWSLHEAGRSLDFWSPLVQRLAVSYNHSMSKFGS